jgi:hypothetical protein
MIVTEPIKNFHTPLLMPLLNRPCHVLMTIFFTILFNIRVFIPRALTFCKGLFFHIFRLKSSYAFLMFSCMLHAPPIFSFFDQPNPIW